VVRSAGVNSLLRQVFVHRAGQCTFTPAETISPLQTLVRRLDTGQWDDLNPATMNAAAAGLGSVFNPAPPSFVRFKPDQFLRPSTLETWKTGTAAIGSRGSQVTLSDRRGGHL